MFSLNRNTSGGAIFAIASWICLLAYPNNLAFASSALPLAETFFEIPLPNAIQPTCLATDDQGFLWIGTDHGLYRFDGGLIRKSAKIFANCPHRLPVEALSFYEGHLYAANSWGVHVQDLKTEACHIHDLELTQKPQWLVSEGALYLLSQVSLFKFESNKQPLKIPLPETSPILGVTTDPVSIWSETKRFNLLPDHQWQTLNITMPPGVNKILPKLALTEYEVIAYPSTQEAIYQSPRLKITDALLDPKGSLWLIREGRLTKLQLPSRNLITIRRYDKHRQLVRNAVSNFAQASNSQRTFIIDGKRLLGSHPQSMPHRFWSSHRYQPIDGPTVLFNGSQRIEVESGPMISPKPQDMPIAFTRSASRSIWFAYRNHVALIHPQDGLQRRVLLDVTANALVEQQNKLYLASNQGLFVCDLNDEEPRFEKVFPGRFIGLHLDQQQHFWALSESKLYYPGMAWNPAETDVFNLPNLQAFTVDRQSFWLASADELWRIREKRRESIALPQADIKIQAMTTDSNHRVWLGTSKGLWIWEKKTSQFQWISSEPILQLQASGNDVYALSDIGLTAYFAGEPLAFPEVVPMIVERISSEGVNTLSTRQDHRVQPHDTRALRMASPLLPRSMQLWHDTTSQDKVSQPDWIVPAGSQSLVTHQFLPVPETSITWKASYLGDTNTFHFFLIGGLLAGLTLGFLWRIQSNPNSGQAETLATTEELESSSETSLAVLDPMSQPDQVKVLIVDDNPIVREVLSGHLEHFGIDYDLAGNGFEALELMEQEENLYSLILLDVMMPGLSGYEVCESIRQNWKEDVLPILFLTARSETENIVRAFEAGANDYLVKPVAKQELLVRMNLHLKIRGMHQLVLREKEWLSREVELERMTTLKRESELRLLHSQMDPHFLQNTLGGISYLCITDPPRAMELLNNLSNLLRQSVKAAPNGWWSFAEEMHTIDMFVQIQQFRFEDRLEVVLDYPEALKEQRIPSFLIEPLVENAIVHGLRGAEQNHVRMICKLADQTLEVRVENSGDPFPDNNPPTYDPEHALGNIDNRLQLIFNSQLEYKYEQGHCFGFKVNLNQPKVAPA
jgi:DNA-binding response OmpR family regulator/ligand-binding sensor domain-containing protein